MYAICKVDIAPLRQNASDKTEMLSQLRFGEIMQIIAISENNKWLKIKTLLDNYEGWIDILQVQKITENYYQQYSNQLHLHQICSSIQTICHLLDNKGNILESTHLSKGAILPFFYEKKDTKNLKPRNKSFFQIEEQLYLFRGEIYEQKYEPKKLISRALSYKNIPYLWGGKSFWGADCSGFVQEIFKSFQLFLPRDAYQQALVGEIVADFDEIENGDVAFFAREERIIHVGLVWKKKNALNIIHARGFIRVDKLDKMGIWSEQEQNYSHYLHSFRRLKF